MPDDVQPPRAEKHPHRTEHHGRRLEDPYHWLRDPGYPDVSDEKVLAYLNAENDYLEARLAPVKQLREQLFEELKARIKEDDESVPFRRGDFWYRRRFTSGQQYPVHVRHAGTPDGDELVLLDVNLLAKGHEYTDVRDMEPSPDDRVLGYSLDTDGSERYELRFRTIETGEALPDRIENTSGSVVWARDDRTVFYARLDEQLRPTRIYRHRLGTSADDDVLVYEEADPSFWTSVDATLDHAFLVITSKNKETAEVRVLDAGDPEGEFRVIAARRDGHDYDIEHAHGQLYIRTNDRHRNFRIVTAPADAPEESSWTELIAPSDAIYVRGHQTFDGHLVTFEREAGLPHVRVRELESGEEHRIEFPDAAYTVGAGTNAEFETSTLRLCYQSLVTPPTVLDYDMTARTREVMKVLEIPSGYDASAYTSERELARAPDGTEVPVSIVHRKDTPLDGSAPVYLYAYGSYGATIDPYFSTNRLSLLDRGFVFALAHVRGGSDMGRYWYEDGKLMKKKNTFTDTIAVAEHLCERRYGSRGRLTVSGGSAGGMLVGAVLNMRPDLFHAAVASVPFVDCLNTMLDSSLPLTPPEYTEWGNPEADPKVFDYIASYSPYDNVAARDYPNLLVTAGIADPRVTYWEPAKYVARLRELKTDDNLLLLHTNMSAGHSGASGRFEALKELALEYAFLMHVYGIVESSAQS